MRKVIIYTPSISILFNIPAFKSKFWLTCCKYRPARTGHLYNILYTYTPYIFQFIMIAQCVCVVHGRCIVVALMFFDAWSSSSNPLKFQIVTHMSIMYVARIRRSKNFKEINCIYIVYSPSSFNILFYAYKPCVTKPVFALQPSPSKALLQSCYYSWNCNAAHPWNGKTCSASSWNLLFRLVRLAETIGGDPKKKAWMG